MEFVTSSDPIVRFAFWSGAAAFLLTIIIGTAILCLYWFQAVRVRWYRWMTTIWRPILLEAIAGTEATLPILRKPCALPFLNLWVYMHESVRGESRHRLNAVARRLGVDRRALHLLQHGNMSARLIAAVALGYLGEQSARKILRRAASEHHPALSLTAAQALIHIDAVAEIDHVVSLLCRRDDWPTDKVTVMLRSAGSDVISLPLERELARSTDDKRVRRLVRYLPLMQSQIAMSLASRIVRRSRDVEVLAASLSALRSPEYLPYVRGFLKHPRATLRARAVEVLGSVGVATDRRYLVHLLSDKDWWVRYRAAQALISFPGVTINVIKTIRSELHDHYARDILEHVLAERS